jgi:hypothetical protein
MTAANIGARGIQTNTGITGVKTKASFGNRFRSKLRGVKPSAAWDCSTYQFRYASLSELEFQ